MKRIMISGAALALAVAGVGVGSADPGSPRGGTGSIGCNDGTVTWDPTTIWPPNHKMQTVNIAYTAGDSNPAHDSARVVVGLITHDQFLEDGTTEMNGSGNTGPDWSGTGNNDSGPKEETQSTTADVRQERSGQEKDGRTYTISVTCTNYSSTLAALEESETVSITVAVPHDQRRVKTDDGS